MPLKKHRVVITGMAVISSLGIDPPGFWENIKEGRSGIRAIAHHDNPGLPCRYAGRLNQVNLAPLPGGISKYLTLNTKIIVSCCLWALGDAGLDIKDNNNPPPGMSMGSFFGNIEKVVSWHKKFARSGYNGITPMDGFDVGHNAGMDYAGILVNAVGIHKMISTGAASGLDAIGSAFHYIRDGRAKIILSGGHENLFPGMYRLLPAGGLLADAGAKAAEIIKPFDKNGSGTVLGEGCGVLVLEELEQARSRKANIYAEISGYGSGFMGSKRQKCTAMSTALQDAGLTPGHIDFINASANGNPVLDKVEAGAIRRLFNSSPSPPVISAVKGAVGECYGASGALQCVDSVFSIKERTAPPILNCVSPVDEIAPYTVGPRKKECRIREVMVNAFDWYGFHSSLIISKFNR
jgi:3-oxoacyl-(acyl-carrier-protein) synthase